MAPISDRPAPRTSDLSGTPASLGSPLIASPGPAQPSGSPVPPVPPGSPDPVVADGRPAWLFVVAWDLHYVGGVNQVVVNLHTQLRERGPCRPLVLVNDWADARLVHEEREGRETLRLRLRAPVGSGPWWKTLAAYGLGLPRLLRRLAALVRAERLRVVNVHYPSLGALNWVLLKRLGLFQGSLLLSFHGLDLAEVEHSRGATRRLWHRLLRAADGVTACSAALAARITTFEPRARVSAVHNGLDLEAFLRGARGAGLSGDLAEPGLAPPDAAGPDIGGQEINREGVNTQIVNTQGVHTGRTDGPADSDGAVSDCARDAAVPDPAVPSGVFRVQPAGAEPACEIRSGQAGSARSGRDGHADTDTGRGAGPAVLTASDAGPATAAGDGDPPGKLPAEYVFCAATFETKKGQDVLIAAFARVAADFPALHLVLAGRSDGTLPGLRAQAAREGLTGRVHFHADVPHARVGTLFARARLFCLPSRDEPFGIVLLEAGACRLPVVASRVGGVPEVITDGEHGLLVPPDDPAALAHALKTLLADPQMGGRLAAALHERVRTRFSWRRAVDEYLRLAGLPPAG